MSRRRYSRREPTSVLLPPILGERDHARYASYCEWQLLKLLLDFELLDGLMDEEGFTGAAVPQLLGLPRYCGADGERQNLRVKLRQRFDALGARPPSLPIDTQLATNIATLAQSLGLSELDVRLLHWRCLADLHAALREATDALDQLSLLQCAFVLAPLLDMPAAGLRDALGFDGKLAQAGLLEVGEHEILTLRGKLDLKSRLAEHLAQVPIAAAPNGVLGFFRHQFAPAQRALLGLAHYPHLAEELALLRPLLAAAMRTRRPGVNVLLYGEPGTGKTQLAAALADSLDVPLFELALLSQRGRPIRGADRLSSYRLAQALLADGGPSLIVFDEVEDVFSRRRDSDDDEASLGIKAWINQCLERNAVPAFWITNRVQDIDPAFLRRFDMVLELPRPPLEVRRELLEQQTEALNLPSAWLDEVAKAPGWSPAHLARAVTVINSLQPDENTVGPPAVDPQPALARLLSGSLTAMGLEGISAIQRATASDDDEFFLSLTNADVPLEKLIEGLQREKRGRLLFHGPPGTGKTELARHISRRLDKPLQVERASTLLGSYVGETERNLAAAFKKAVETGAVLVIDEVDGFLRDRRQAQRSWELSQVNEFLVQLERFKGVFVGTTNLLQELDAAALRRFDLKIGFRLLSRAQAEGLLSAAAELLDLDTSGLPQLLERRGDALEGLSIGDFEAYANQCELIRPESLEALLDGLLASAPHAHRPVQRMGFVRA